MRGGRLNRRSFDQQNREMKMDNIDWGFIGVLCIIGVAFFLFLLQLKRLADRVGRFTGQPPVGKDYDNET
jgi:hypothetical protein